MDIRKRLIKVAKKILSDVNFSTQQEFEEYIKNHPNYREDTNFFVDGMQVSAPPREKSKKQQMLEEWKRKKREEENKKQFGDSRINWNNESGMGSMPVNKDIDYLGFQIELSAEDFRDLVPKGRTSSDLTELKEKISSGKAVASPTLFADWNEEKNRWEVTGHEGRSRTDAITELYGKNTMMPVHIIPYKLRARDISEKMLNAPFIPQDCTNWKDEKMKKLFEKKFSNNRKKIKKENQ